jgi:hypothetical protein
MLACLVFMTLLPLQVSSIGQSPAPISKPVLVAAFVDIAKIMGLPKFRLRNSQGHPYVAHQALVHEPLAIVQSHAGMANLSDLNLRKAYIQTYIKR